MQKFIYTQALHWLSMAYEAGKTGYESSILVGYVVAGGLVALGIGKIVKYSYELATTTPQERINRRFQDVQHNANAKRFDKMVDSLISAEKISDVYNLPLPIGQIDELYTKAVAHLRRDESSAHETLGEEVFFKVVSDLPPRKNISHHPQIAELETRLRHAKARDDAIWANRSGYDYEGDLHFPKRTF